MAHHQILGKGFQPKLAVVIVKEPAVSPVPPAHDVIGLTPFNPFH